MVSKIKFSILIGVMVSSFGCSGGLNGDFRNIGSGILGSTGIISGSQAEAVLAAGDKFSKATRGLTDQQEYYLGRSVSAMVLSKYRPLRDTKSVAYINKVGKLLAKYSDRPETFGGYFFSILDTNEINALSAPGGFVFISRGFINILSDEDTLAAVLAHEIGHIVKGHGVAAISQSNLTEALLIVGKEAAASQAGGVAGELTSLFGESVTDIAETLLTKGYSRSQEYEADEFAAELMIKAGYNPLALKSALEKLKQHSSEESGWATTHPNPEKRIDELDEDLIASSNEQQRAVRAQRFKSSLSNIKAG